MVRLPDPLRRDAPQKEREIAPMKAQDFRRWRHAMGWSQRQTAEALGMTLRSIQYYERGERDGQEVNIPRSVELACHALSHAEIEALAPDVLARLRQLADSEQRSINGLVVEALRDIVSKYEETARPLPRMAVGGR